MYDLPLAYRGAEKLVTRYRRPDSADFDDLVQEAVLYGWRAATRPGVRKPVALANVAGRGRVSNLVFGHRSYTGSETRKGKRPDAFQCVYTPDLPEVTVFPDGLEDQLDVRAAVSRLPEPERRVLWLRFWCGLPEVEIARKLGVNRWAVARLREDALKRLQESGMIAP